MEGSKEDGERKGLNSRIIIHYNMSQLFKAKVRKVGTSLGFLIPNEVVKEEHLNTGEEVHVQVLKQRKLRLIEEGFGIAKGAKPFKREKDIDRLENY